MVLIVGAGVAKSFLVVGRYQNLTICPALFCCNTMMSISPEYFIKPDPALTRQETRHYIRSALRSFLTGPALLRDARAFALSPVAASVAVEDLKDGRCSPAARLVVLARLLETDDLADVAAVALAMCQSHLDVSEDVERLGVRGHDNEVTDEAAGDVASDEDDEEGDEEGESEAVTETDSTDSLTRQADAEHINHVALGFILTDRLPNGKTIRPYWDHSPFATLREAPPLGNQPSMDDIMDEHMAAVSRFCRSGNGIAITAGIVAAVLGFLAVRSV
jgi:hypothetical protein